MGLVLIDTSVWVSLLRKSATHEDLDRMQRLLENGGAAWCDMVKLELWSGVRNTRERKQLDILAEGVEVLKIGEDVWQDACLRAGVARSKGITAPASDHVIFACAQCHGVELWHDDKHFDALGRL